MTLEKRATTSEEPASPPSLGFGDLMHQQDAAPETKPTDSGEDVAHRQILRCFRRRKIGEGLAAAGVVAVCQ